MPRRIDNYFFRGTIGSGASGTVQLAYGPDLDRHVAVKEFSPALVADPHFLERFRAEAQVMARLDNDHCVRVFDFIEEPGRAWLVSEYVEGASLRKVLDQAGFLTPEEALGVLKGSLIGLSHAHSLGLVHRNLKLDNVIADRDGVSKLADFGQALFTPGPGAAGGALIGTPAYMSPEQVGGGRIDYRSDIYSAGAMLFELLAGKTPYTADNVLAMMRLHLSAPVPDPRAANTELPEGIAGVVMRAMAKDPNDRQQTASQFLTDLEAAAVAGYGQEWERRSSIRGLVASVIAAGEVLLVGQGAALATSAGIGEATVGTGAAGAGTWWTNKYVIAGGIAGILLLGGGGALVLASGILGGHPGGGVAAISLFASPSPSDSASPGPELSSSPPPFPSPSPSPRPRPSPSPSPSPSPIRASPAATHSPTPPAQVGPVTVVGATVLYERYMPRAHRYESSPSLYKSASSPLPLSCGTGTVPVHLFEEYTLAYPGFGPDVTTTLTWTGQLPGGGTDSGPAYAGDTATPGTHSHASPTASTVPGYADGQMAPPSGTGGSIGFTLSWTNPDGHSTGTASAVLNYVCA